MTANSTFYRKPALGFAGFASCGPFPALHLSAGGASSGAFVPLEAGQGGDRDIGAGSHPIRNVYSLEGMHRARKFPGVLTVERPSRGVIAFPAKAAITNHSTITLTDANDGPVVFELVTAGIVTPGNEIVDLTPGGVVTAAQVAAVFAAAVAAWMVSTTPAAPSGFQASVYAANPIYVVIRQANKPKNYGGVANGDHPQKLSWFLKTWGSLGNIPITTTDGAVAVAGMVGGKKRLPGIYAVPHPKTPICVGIYFAPLKIEEIG